MRAIWSNWIEKPFALPLGLMAVILVASALGFARLESGMQSEPVGFFEGLWWAVVTLFTVGYGDFAPRTVPGRLLGMAVMASGIGLLSTVTGSMASAMVERRFKKRRGLLPVTAENHVLVMGWNGHGAMFLEKLRRRPEYARAPVVVAADMEPGAFEQLAESLGLGQSLSFVRGNPAHRSTLERANPAKARIAYILASEDMPAEEADNASVLAALTLRGLAPRLTLYAEALREQSREHLLRAGVTKVMGREELAGKALAFMAAHPVMHDLLGKLLAGGSEGGGLVRFRPLTAEEKALRWPDLVRASMERDGELPLAVCRLPRELHLADVLDASKALDAYVMELFQAAGRDTSLGTQGHKVLLNPGPGEDLSGYDGVICMGRAQ